MAEREAPVQPGVSAGPKRKPPERRTSLYLVCSPQARVGKTLTARLLLDFVLSGCEGALGFDTNRLDPGLAAVFPRQTSVVDLALTRGQMKLFDTLVVDDAIPKVVDLWHVSYELFFERAQNLGFFEEAWNRGIEPLILLHTDHKEWFADEAARLLASWPCLDIALVHNEGLVKLRGKARLGAVARLSAQPLVVPELDVIVQRVLNEPEVRIHGFLQKSLPDAHVELQGRIGKSLAPVFGQFRLLELARDVGLPGRRLLPRRNIALSG